MILISKSRTGGTKLSLKLKNILKACSFSTTRILSNGIDYDKIFKSGIVPEYFNFATDVFDLHAETIPSKLALWIENESHSKQWSFSQLQRESVRAAIFLQRNLNPNSNLNSKHSKLNSGTSIFVMLPRIPEWWFVYLATLRLGGIFSPGTIQLTPEDIAYRLKISQPSVVITDSDNMWKIEEAQRLERFPSPIKIVVPKKRRRNEIVTAENWLQYDELEEDVDDAEVLAFRNKYTKSSEISEVFFTSGTTGKPKRVAHTNASYGIGHYSTTKLLMLEKGDIQWNLSDPGWAKSSYASFYAPWIAGAGVYINQMERFEARPVLEVLCSRPITKFCAPPTLFRSMVQINDEKLFKFRSLKAVRSGGEALNPEVCKIWKEKTGIELRGLYGQTETTSSVGHKIDDNKQKSHSMGRPLYGYDIKVVDDNGVEVDYGKEGNIGIRVKPNRPIGIFKGYLNDEEGSTEINATHNCYVGDYFMTGDLGMMDEEGYLYFVGRADDVIISAGYRIGPFELESVLQQHPAVAENAVVPSPHSERGSVVKAYIILTSDYVDEDPEKLVTDIQNFCKIHTAPYKYPRRIEFVRELPKTVSGKILRRELKAREDAIHLQEKGEDPKIAYAKDHTLII